MIAFACRCGQDLEADDDQAGGRVTCPNCGNVRSVPAGGAGLSVLWVVLRAMLLMVLGVSVLHMIVGEGPIPLQTGAICIAVALAGLACSTPRTRD
jgi:hypothetical protein